MEMQLDCSIYACLLSDFPFPFNISRNNLETCLSTREMGARAFIVSKTEGGRSSLRKTRWTEKKGILFLKREKDRFRWEGEKRGEEEKSRPSD